MKHLHWVIFSDDVRRSSPLAELLGAFDGSDVLCSLDANRSDAVTSLADHPDANAIYIAAKGSIVPTLAVMMMKRGLPTVLENPTTLSYDDFIRIGRICQQTGTGCFVNWTYFDTGTARRLQRQVHPAEDERLLSLNLTATYPPHHSCFRTEAMTHLHFLQEMFGIIIEAKGLSGTRHTPSDTPTNTALLKFESGLVGTAAWIGHENARQPLCNIQIITSRRQLNIKWEGNHLSTDLIHPDTITQHQTPDNPMPIIRQITEDLQGFSVCTSTCLHSTPAAWATDRINSDDDNT